MRELRDIQIGLLTIIVLYQQQFLSETVAAILAAVQVMLSVIQFMQRHPAKLTADERALIAAQLGKHTRTGNKYLVNGSTIEIKLNRWTRKVQITIDGVVFPYSKIETLRRFL